jgi:hypothetical protein
MWVGKAVAEKGYFVIMSITKLRASIVVSLKAAYKGLMNVVKKVLKHFRRRSSKLNSSILKCAHFLYLNKNGRNCLGNSKL